MLGTSLFDNDPFFSSHREQMRRMEEMFNTPIMPRGGLLGLEDGRHHNHRQGRRHQHHERQDRQVAHRRHPTMDPFAHFESMFSNMRNMMNEMHRAFDQTGPRDPNMQCFQQSSYYSSSNIGGQAPKVYQATSSLRQLPGGVRETRKAVRDSETGVERVAMGHHINDRGHIIERSRNAKTGESNENQDFINLDEHEAQAFDQEYRDRLQTNMGRVEQRRRRYKGLLGQHPSHGATTALPEPTADFGQQKRTRKTSHRRE